jgi:2-keto-3-deoxy-L-rhamnonate aldolase RhmA
MFQAMRASGATLMARVPWLEPGIIMKALDAGAYGIICPMVNSAEEAARFVSYLRYPPLGQRSFGPTRVSFAAGANYAGEANDNILAFAMIETAEGMANLDAIAATPGLDGIYVGPADLTLSLTQGRLPPGFDREEPEMIAALQTIVAACKKKRPPRRAALRDAGLCRPSDRLGLRHDHGRGRLALPCSRRRGRRRGVPQADRRGRREDRKGGLLMPHLLIAGKLHPSGSICCAPPPA